MGTCDMKEYFKRHGTFSWNELMTPDLAKAKDFYGEIFGWTFTEETIAEGPMAGKPYVMAHNGDALAAGMMPLPCKETPPLWGAYVTVDNLDATLGRVAQLGGKIVVGSTPIKGFGLFAVIQDTTGAFLSLMEYHIQK